jgi:hypothetical protein
MKTVFKKSVLMTLAPAIAVLAISSTSFAITISGAKPLAATAAAFSIENKKAWLTVNGELGDLAKRKFSGENTLTFISSPKEFGTQVGSSLGFGKKAFGILNEKNYTATVQYLDRFGNVVEASHVPISPADIAKGIDSIEAKSLADGTLRLEVSKGIKKLHNGQEVKASDEYFRKQMESVNYDGRDIVRIIYSEAGNAKRSIKAGLNKKGDAVDIIRVENGREVRKTIRPTVDGLITAIETESNGSLKITVLDPSGKLHTTSYSTDVIYEKLIPGPGQRKVLELERDSTKIVSHGVERLAFKTDKVKGPIVLAEGEKVRGLSIDTAPQIQVRQVVPEKPADYSDIIKGNTNFLGGSR